MSERNVIAEIRAMRWMIAVLLTQLVILTAAFVAVAVQALSTPVTQGMPHSTVALVYACPTISTDKAAEETMTVANAPIPALFSVLGIQFLARG